MSSTRLDLRLDPDIKAKAEKAAALLGMSSLTEYVVKLMDKNATRIIAKHENIIVENDVFDRFMDACQQAKKPNKALLEAKTFTQKQGIQ